jgi:uncharacterized iron-regulated membrane protein
MKIFFRNIHLYLALVAGITIFISCLTGAILVFEKEFQNSIYPERYKVEPIGRRLSVDQLIDNLSMEIPLAKITGVRVYEDPTRTTEVYFEEKKREEHNHSEGKKEVIGNKKDMRKGGGHDNQQIAFINPYTGKIITFYNHKKAFFGTVLGIHRWLLVQPVGKTIMGISAFGFLFILTTGIVLWWPKNKKILKQRLTLKWSGWKRINHDLHIVLGFYSAIFLFAIALTGTAISFKWMSAPIFWMTNSDNKPPEPTTSQFLPNQKVVSYQVIFDSVVQKDGKAEFYNISAPKDSSGVYTINILPANAPHEKASNQVYIDQYSGKQIGELKFEDRNKGQKIRSFYLPIHMGTIGGMPTKTLAFLVCLAGITFPVTGVIMWLNRLKKKDKKEHKRKTSRLQKEVVNQI